LPPPRASSWRRLGSDGAWIPVLAARGVSVAPLEPANCGFNAAWSAHFVQRFAGQPLKSVAAVTEMSDGSRQYRRGECMVTAQGIEGGLVYAFSGMLRDEIRRIGSAVLYLDLLPDRDASFVLTEVSRSRGARSLSSHLRSRLGLHGVKTGLLRECLSADEFTQPAKLAQAIKRLPVRLDSTRPIDEAISTAGGVTFDSLDERLMLTSAPGVFCAGEMLDWDAPTGGYLLTACLASGYVAGRNIADWLSGPA
nr:TIGR03862 family flavoprotein [Pseudomonas sp.]